MAGKDIKPSTKGAGMDFPTSSKTGLTRREVLGRALKTGAGFLAPDIIGGGLIDLVKSSYPSLPSSSISKSLADLVAATQLLEFEDVDLDGWGIDPNDIDIDDLIHGEDSIVNTLEDSLMDLKRDPPQWTDFEDILHNYNRTISTISGHESDVLDKMTDLEIAFRDKYPDDFVDWLFKSPKGKGILSGTRRAIDEVWIYPGQSGELPGITEYVAPDNSDIEEIATNILPELLETAVKQFEIEKEEWKKIVDKVYKPDLKDLPEESSLEDIATIPTFRILRKALGKLGASKPEAIEGPKPEVPKQIEEPSKSPVQMANVANALRRLKGATSLGAIASMYPISPAGEDSDVVGPYPLIRPQF
jgi:hypothetical protein